MKVKYNNRVEKTFQSIKDIFGEKVTKLAKFEREMKELEKDVRLNYSNIIRLMDLEPFYEIIYRYNKKLNNIKSVFTEFKGKPDEIPEDAVRVKGIRSRLSFVTNFGRRLEHFFADGDSYDSNNTSHDAEIETDRLPPQRVFLEAVGMTPIHIGGFGHHSRTIKASKTCQTDHFDYEHYRKKVVATSPGPAKDELKAQAEMLIRSVDTLISKEDHYPVMQAQTMPSKFIKPPHSGTASGPVGLMSPGNQGSGHKNSKTTPEFRQSKSITKAEIAKRIQAHFNSANHIGKPRSSSNTTSKGSVGANTAAQTSPLTLEKNYSEGVLGRDINIEQVAKEISSKVKDSKAKLPVSREKNSTPSHNGPNISYPIPTPAHLALNHKQKMSKQALQQQSAGVIPNPAAIPGYSAKEMHGSSKSATSGSQNIQSMVSKTDKLLQLYRKNKQSSDDQTN